MNLLENGISQKHIVRTLHYLSQKKITAAKIFPQKLNMHVCNLKNQGQVKQKQLYDIKTRPLDIIKCFLWECKNIW